MADISTESAVQASADDVDLLDVNVVPVADATGDDYDFDLGGTDAKDAELTEDSGHDQDEIGYEDDGEATAEAALTNAQLEDSMDDHETEDINGEVERADEIDYEDVDLATAHTGENEVPEQVHNHQDAAPSHDEIAFAFEVNEGENVASETVDSIANEEQDKGVPVLPSGAHQKEEDEEDEDEEDDGGDDDEDEEKYEDNEEDDDDDDDGDVDSSSVGSLNAGLGRLQDLYTGSAADVTVTWGDQVCPLFKAPGVDDPDLFYLEDAEALNYPLSKFLQAIRTSISSWVSSSDEIIVQVDDLGLEFGETTTDALLSQVTFNKLIALHNTLLKNDDPESSKGVHITLITRPNCLLRLRDLVTGAASGKGLSSFQQQSPTAMDEDTSDDSEENQAESGGGSSEDNAFDDMVEEGNDSENVTMPGAFEEVAKAIASEDEEDDGEVEGEYEGAEPDVEDEGHKEHAHEEELDFMAYTNEVEGNNDDTAGAILGGPYGYNPTVSEVQDPDGGHELGAVTGGLLHEATGNVTDTDHHIELDLLEDLDHSSDVQESGHGEGDFLDLGDEVGEINATDAFSETIPAVDTKVSNDVDGSLDSSATTTLDHDEIDYEDTHNAAVVPDTENTTVLAEAGVDEIDWDDEIKNFAPDDLTLIAAGKRARDVNDGDDGVVDDSPDAKRHRTDDLLM